MALTIEQKMTRRLYESVRGNKHMQHVIGTHVAFARTRTIAGHTGDITAALSGVLAGFAIGSNRSDDFDSNAIFDVAEAVAQRIIREGLK